MSSKVQKIMVQPINLIFRYLQNKSKVQIWLFDKTDLRIEGQIIGFDEFMNLVLENGVEVNTKNNTRIPVGRLLLKGDNITLIQGVDN
ncbi:small nuclear ribonucleoprotein-like protein E [Pilobolus umbonatus]|nr:small nuclear ribonucleoprotein-like protein E [Pilobolus umbonatus]